MHVGCEIVGNLNYQNGNSVCANNDGSYKISVIVPVYNAGIELNNAIESIINQTFGFENIELIFVDDASTDNSCNIIEEYMAVHSNIKLIKLKQNSGLPGGPRSLGIKYSSAKYLIFLDSDEERFMGKNRLIHGHEDPFPVNKKEFNNRPYNMKVYLPSRTCMVLISEENEKKYDIERLNVNLDQI